MTDANRSTMSPPMLSILLVGIIALKSSPYLSVFVVPFGVTALCVFAFLAGVVVFVDRYTRKELRQSCEATEHLCELSKGIPPSAQSLEDFDRISNEMGLSALWKKEIQGNENVFKILLTGVTGYVGKAFLFQLLREIANAEKDAKKKLPHKVYVMARGNARKNLSAATRLSMIRDEPMFAPYKEQWDAIVMAAESGDLQDENCGMSSETLDMLKAAKLTHIVHCAADVNFNRPIPEAAGMNISPALKLQKMSKEWPTCTRFVHCSTCFINPECGSEDNPLPEQLYSLGKYDPQDIYDSMRGDQELALKVKKEFDFPNNYCFTKCVAEHLVARNNDDEKVELRIVRPAIVGPAWLLPKRGWNGDKPSTISGVFLLWGTRVIRFAPVVTSPMPVIPVDVVAACIVNAMVAPSVKKVADKYPLSVRNIIWSHKSPKQFMSGLRMAKSAIHAAMSIGHFTTTEASVSYMLLDLVVKIPFLFSFLHAVFNLGPLYLLKFVCWVVKTAGIKSVLEKVPVVQLFKFSDMLNLYKPFMGRVYKFASTIDVPETFDNDCYVAGLITATHSFWVKMFPGTVQDLRFLELLPKGRLDFWWAMTQPSQTFQNKMVGFLACKILRATCSSAEFDFHSADEVLHLMVQLEKSMASQKHSLCFASTRKSVLDFILVKFLAFNLSAMGFDIPTVLSKTEFEDAALSKKLDVVSRNYDRHASVAAFMERTGLSKKLNATAVQKIAQMANVDDVIMIPTCMEHQGLNDSEVILQTVRTNSDVGLKDMVSLYWKICVLKQAKPVSLGDVRISFGSPFELQATSDAEKVVQKVYSELDRVSSASS
ncbi:glyceronephosphate O-acyltransferase [Fistulifera solaris]|uniref:Fatty acyl-CoA reductase n=1 Tax=Fistulifera solaris TaxID=1519565 RepID=A0A1Z5JCQ4_FISSO|nr:glyceronephosphate O-acyltransferase [Fistulifera solaris]|eukprot:GAX11777.1 glyceronephosphate O-acyltransferase [Fistulifera solaris]